MATETEVEETTEETTDDAADELEALSDEELRQLLRDERAQRERTAEALKKANAEAKKYRLRVRETKAAGTGESGDSKAEVEAAVAAARQEVEQTYSAKLVRLKAEAALAAAGIAVKPERAVGLLQVEDLDVDDDGNVTGLAEAIEELKVENPQLFVKPRSSSTDHKATGKGPGAKEKTAAERLAARLQGET